MSNLLRAKSFLAKKAASSAAARATVGSSDRGALAIGHLTIETRAVDRATGARGEWQLHEQGHNLVVTQAESLQAQMAIGAANSAFNYIELGDPAPATPPSLGDTTLEQSTAQRKACALTATGRVVTAESLWLVGDGNGFTYTEAGLFTGPFAAGSMFARKTFTGITKTVAFEMRFTWHITFLVQTGGSSVTGIALIGSSTVTSYTYAVAAGGENSVAATFDFSVGANNVDVFMNQLRLTPGVEYNEVTPGALTPATLGNPLNKGINLVGFSANLGDRFLLVHRAQA